jgi:hypothetical protein
VAQFADDSGPADTRIDGPVRRRQQEIWATEYGQSAGVVSEARQAAFIGDFLRAWRDLDYAGPAFIRDYTSSDPATATFGVYRQDWTPKASVGVIETVIDENQAILARGGGIEL